MIEGVLMLVGSVLILVGSLFDLLAALGLLRLPDLYTRIHALTMGTIGGAVLPLIGVALVAAGWVELGSYRWYLAGAAIVTAILILMLAPAGSHAIARAAYRARSPSPSYVVIDELAKKVRGGGR